MKKWLLWVLMVLPMCGWAQQYTGLSGLIHVPSADMCPNGEARVSGHFLNREFLPPEYNFEGTKYHTGNVTVSITPYSWIELAYTMTFMKDYQQLPGNDYLEDKVGFYRKDRYLSVKVRPLKEGKWWPSIAVGANDPVNTFDNESKYFTNFYVAATKHFDWNGHLFGVHLCYRKYDSEASSMWDGPVGGLTYQPSFQQNLRFIVEYTGDNVNVGFDWKLWNHFLIQASLQDGKYISGGLCLCLNLLGKNKK